MLQDILKTAMLGTEKAAPTASSPFLEEVSKHIATTRQDKEDAFLKLTAAYLLLQEAGKQLPVNDFRHTPAPPETKAQIPAKASSLIDGLIQSKAEVLLAYALYRCAKQDKIVRPELVPVLLTLASATKANSNHLSVCGERGRWLAGLHDGWSKLYAPAEEDSWDTGTLPQRKAYLQALRATDPQKARELLAENLAQENANTRTELLETLLTGLAAEDIPFLENQLKDKSSKVKEQAYKLLKLLPQSNISRQYVTFLKEALQLKEERNMLLVKKKKFELNTSITFPEHLAESGLEKVSSQKGVEDAAFWVAQAIGFVHPHFWQEAYGLTAEELVQLMAAHPQHPLFMPALALAAAIHHDQPLAKALLRGHHAPGPQLLLVLELQDRWAFASQFMGDRNSLTLLLQVLMDGAYTSIPAEVCHQLMQAAMREPYAIQHSLYHTWALYMPPPLLQDLQQLAEREVVEYQQRFLKNVATEMIRIIETKEQLNASL